MKRQIMKEDKYVVYHGMKEGMADFALYDKGGIIRGVTMDPEEVPTEIEYQDHFWVEIEDGDIVNLQFDSELTEKKKEEYQNAAEIHEQMRNLSKRDEEGN